MNQWTVPGMEWWNGMVEWNTGMTFDTSKSIVAHSWWLVKVLENVLRLDTSQSVRIATYQHT